MARAFEVKSKKNVSKFHKRSHLDLKNKLVKSSGHIQILTITIFKYAITEQYIPTILKGQQLVL